MQRRVLVSALLASFGWVNSSAAWSAELASQDLPAANAAPAPASSSAAPTAPGGVTDPKKTTTAAPGDTPAAAASSAAPAAASSVAPVASPSIETPSAPANTPAAPTPGADQGTNAKTLEAVHVKAQPLPGPTPVTDPTLAPVDPNKALNSAGMTDQPHTAPAPGAPDNQHNAPVAEKAEPGEKPQKLLVDLVLNGDDRGVQFAMLEGKRVWLLASALSDLGAINDNAGTTGVKEFQGKSFVDPSVRFPGATVALSDDQSKLTITLPGTAWATHRIMLNAREPLVPLTSSPSAFLNYSLGTTDKLSGSAYVNGGVSVGTAQLQTSTTWSPTQKWMLGQTFLSYDQPAQMRRWTLGDQNVIPTDGTGGGGSIAGIGLQRAFDLNPYLITLPQPNIAGVLQAPGTIEVYRNGMLIAVRPVPAGPFSLDQLGVGIGQNNVRVVVRDPFGGTQEINQSFYGVNNNLAKGLTEFSYQLGIAAPQPGYYYQPSRPELAMHQRWGVTDWATLGYRLEGERGLGNLGLDTDFRLPFGAIHLAGAGSHDSDHGNGWGGNFSYSVSGSRWNLSFGGSKFSDNYRKLGDKILEDTINKGLGIYSQQGIQIQMALAALAATGQNTVGFTVDQLLNPANPASPLNPANPGHSLYTIPTASELLAQTRLLHQEYVSAGVSPFRNTVVQATFTRSHYADGRTDVVKSIGATYDLRWASFYAGIDDSTIQRHNNRTVSFNVTVPLGQQTASFNHVTTKQSNTDSVDFQRSLPDGNGVGYTFHGQHDSLSGNSENATFSAQDRLGRVNVQLYNSSLGSSGQLQVAGSVVWIGNGLYLGQPLNGTSYALVKIGDDMKGVPVIRENQTVGKTGSSGTFLVPNLLPYQNNTMGFEQKDIPPSYTFQEHQRTVNVPRFGGTVVDFNVHPLRAARGRLLVDKTQMNGGTITLIKVLERKGEKPHDIKTDEPLGTKGNFFLQDLPEGRYELQVQWQGAQASCPITVPVTKSPIQDLKNIACTWVGAAPDVSALPGNDRGVTDATTSPPVTDGTSAPATPPPAAPPAGAPSNPTPKTPATPSPGSPKAPAPASSVPAPATPTPKAAPSEAPPAPASSAPPPAKPAPATSSAAVWTTTPFTWGHRVPTSPAARLLSGSALA